VDDLDRRIINHLQGGFPVSERPYAEVAVELGTDERTLIEHLQRLLDDRLLTRFGPMYQAERLGGGLTLAAMQVPERELDRVVAEVNAYPEVAHNYQREHDFNVWFVLATDAPERIDAAIADIAARTGYPVYNMPKCEEFFVGLRLEV
jgi:DNA-binding Lrp family transcriptional regulator